MTALLLASVLCLAQGKQDLKIENSGSVRHPSVVRAIAVTPDSRRAFIGLNDGALLAYALETRKPIKIDFRVYSAIYDLAINPNGDRLAMTDGDGYVTTLDTASLKPVAAVRLKSNPERVVFALDGQSLYVAMSNGHLLKLKAADLSTEKDIFPTDRSRVLALARSGDGKLIATSDKDGQIKLWDADTLALVKTWKAHKQWASAFAFDPSGDYLVSGGEESVLNVWKLSDNSLLKESKEYHQEAIQCIAFAPDGRMVTGGYDGLCQFWDKKFTAGKSYPNYRGYITAGAISPDGRWLVRGGSALDFVPLERPDAFERVADYGGAIMSFAVAADRKRFATGGLDRRLISWKVDKGITSQTAQLDDWVTAVDFCRDGQSIAAGQANGKIEIYAAASMTREEAWRAHKGRITGLASALGKLVSIGDDAAVRVWDTSGKQVKTFNEKSPCRSIAVRDKHFAVGAADGTFSVYDASTLTAIKHLRGRPHSITALGYSRGGSRLMVGYFDGGLESFDTESWSVVHYRAGQGDSVLSISANMNNDIIAIGFRDGHAKLYDVVSLEEGPSVQPRPVREVFAVQWVLDEHTFAAAGASNAVHFYRLKGDIEAWTTRARTSYTQTEHKGQLSAKVSEQSHPIKMTGGRTYLINMESPQFDTLLRLLDDQGKVVAENDDISFPDNLNSRIVFTAPRDGDFSIVATSFQQRGVGAYAITVREYGAKKD